MAAHSSSLFYTIHVDVLLHGCIQFFCAAIARTWQLNFHLNLFLLVPAQCRLWMTPNRTRNSYPIDVIPFVCVIVIATLSILLILDVGHPTSKSRCSLVMLIVWFMLTSFFYSGK